jgi:hypothetical protein
MARLFRHGKELDLLVFEGLFDGIDGTSGYANGVEQLYQVPGGVSTG